MTLLWIILLVAAHFTHCVMSNYHCTMKSFEVTCSGINADQLPQDVSVILNKTDVSSLNITNGIISTISPVTFKDFINLQSLYIIDSGVSYLEDDAFSFSLDLQDLSLSNNALTEFNLKSFPPENALRTLDLSYNVLNDFSGFNISHFPRLTVLNLVGNFLSYLPASVLAILEEQNEFYLMADHNPWNCSHLEWSEHLNDKLINAFCTNKTYSFTTQATTEYTEETTVISENVIKNENIQDFLDTSENSSSKISQKEIENSQIECKNSNCFQCSFYYSLWWFFCGIWIGIIIGNILKIKNLIFKRSITYADKYTQSDYTHMEHYFMTVGYNTRYQKPPATRSVHSKEEESTL